MLYLEGNIQDFYEIPSTRFQNSNILNTVVPKLLKVLLVYIRMTKKKFYYCNCWNPHYHRLGPIFWYNKIYQPHVFLVLMISNTTSDINNPRVRSTSGHLISRVVFGIFNTKVTGDWYYHRLIIQEFRNLSVWYFSIPPH